jgi:hypothetical protein
MIRVIDLASDGRESIILTNKIIDIIVCALSPRFGTITELERALVDEREDIKIILRDATRDRVHIKDLPEYVQ